jgi:hypothetical protein
MARIRKTPFPVIFDLRTLDYDQRLEAEEALGIKIIGTAPLSKHDAYLSAPIFSNLSNRIPIINSSDEIGVHQYSEPSIREYTRTGAYLYKHDKPNVASHETILSGVPHAENVQTVEALALHPYRVFIDMKSGTVQAVVGSYDKSTLSFYRRYFSLLPNPIDEISSKETIELAKEVRKILFADGETVCWMTRANLAVFLRSPRMPHQKDHKKKWEAEEKPITFTPLNNGVPISINPHYVLAYNFRYVNFKTA